MLGRGNNVAYLYDRGGERMLAEFERPVKVVWGRGLDDISTASVLMTVDRLNCEWLGQIRAGRHELVIRRNGDRVWEGTCTRPVFGPDTVEVLAKDVLYPTTRRVHRGRFTDPANGVAELEQALRDAYRFDDPNVLAWLEMRAEGAPLVETAVNRADQYYWDAIGDILDQGVHVTTVGRRIVAWPSSTVLSQTTLLRSGEGLNSDISVIEDALSMNTRAVLAGGDTFGASTPEPEIINWATDPNVEDDTKGWTASKYFTVSVTPLGTWGAAAAGSKVGLCVAKPPSKSGIKKSTYAARLQAFEATDVILLAQPQAITVHQGEDLSATLMVRGQGAVSRYGRVGLRLVGIDKDGIVAKNSFAEGPPVVLAADHTPQQLFVTGTVPADITKAFVEVFRDTNYVVPVLDKDGIPVPDDQLTDKQRVPVKWKAGDGFTFDRFGWWRGRIEPWFSGDTPDDALFAYDWQGGPNASTSVRTLRDPATYVDPYYGLVETLGKSEATTRVGLEAAALDVVAETYPAPLAVNIAQDAALRPDAPIAIDELVAGTLVPLQVTSTCREVVVATILDSMTVTQDKSGEKVTVTLLSGRTWEV
jgi:hypothetical protein